MWSATLCAVKSSRIVLPRHNPWLGDASVASAACRRRFHECPRRLNGTGDEVDAALFNLKDDVPLPALSLYRRGCPNMLQYHAVCAQ